MNPDHLLKSFLLRQKEGDREAREVFAEFIRVVTERSNEEVSPTRGSYLR